jgi:RecA-family ATPase
MSTAERVATPWTDAEHALARLSLDVRRASPAEQLTALHTGAIALRRYVNDGYLNPAALDDEIFVIGEDFGLPEADVAAIAREATLPPSLQGDDPPPDDDGGFYPEPCGRCGRTADKHRFEHTPKGLRISCLPAGDNAAVPAPLVTVSPAAWRGTEPVDLRWLAQGRIRANDLAILSGNGGAGKTEIAAHLLVSVAAGLGDWLGCVVDAGPALFVSCEEDETDVRDRVERIAKHRSIDPHGLPDLHLVFPDLDATWLATAEQRTGRVSKTPLLIQIEAWIDQFRPRLIVIDSVAAVFDGDAIQRRQVRAFLAMLRKIAREREVGILLLDHPSVRGMADGTGTANSVDWRNSVRSMMHLSDPAKDDPDARDLELKKTNRGKPGEKVALRWNGLTFSTEATAGASSPYRAAAERDVDDVFLRLLDKRIAQGRPVRPSSGRGSAPAEMEGDPEAKGIKAEAFRAAMERLFTAGTIVTVETGPKSARRKHIERKAVPLT